MVLGRCARTTRGASTLSVHYPLVTRHAQEIEHIKQQRIQLKQQLEEVGRLLSVYAVRCEWVL